MIRWFIPLACVLLAGCEAIETAETGLVPSPVIESLAAEEPPAQTPPASIMSEGIMSEGRSIRRSELGGGASVAPLGGHDEAPRTTAAQKLAALRDARDFGMIGLLAAPDPYRAPEPLPSLVEPEIAPEPDDMLGEGVIAAPAPSPPLEERPHTVTHSPRGKVKVGKISVVGSLKSKRVKRALRSQRSAFERCYEHGLRSDSELRGRITLEIEITSSGTVIMVTNIDKSDTQPDGTTLGDTSVIRCVEMAVRSLSFDGSSGGSNTVRFSLDLAPPAATKPEE